MSGATIHGFDEEKLRRTRDTVTITPETWGGMRLIRLVIECPDAPIEGRVSQVFLRAGAVLSDFGHALVNMAHGEIVGDVVEPWEPKREPMSAERLDDIRSALQEPHATSRGHKRTIRVAREMADEIVRLRAELDARGAK